MKKLILLIIIAGLVYLNYTTPKYADHQAALLSKITRAGGIPEAAQPLLWKDSDYTNFMVCSVVKTTEESKLVSIGYLKKVKVVNDKWAAEMVKKFQNIGNNW
jgi:uncharacterized protein (DUF302 family)